MKLANNEVDYEVKRREKDREALHLFNSHSGRLHVCSPLNTAAAGWTLPPPRLLTTIPWPGCQS